MLLSDAERHISSSLAGLLIAAVPFVGALLALAHGRRRPARRAAVSPACSSASSGSPPWSGFDVSGGNLGAIGEIAVVTGRLRARAR